MAAIGRWAGTWSHSRGVLALTLALASLALVAAPGASARVASDAMPPVKQCDDNVDNDGDGLVDYPSDPDCGSSNDNSEQADAGELAACADLADNDGDGKVDLADPGCSGSSDNDEADPPPPPPPPPPARCADGSDNDGDGKIDLADPGCTGSSDNDETDPPPPPPPPPPPALCADGKDNDGDGKIDMADPGCTGSSDNDETDPPPPPPASGGSSPPPSGGSTSTQPAPTFEVLGTQTSEPGPAAAGQVVSPFPVVRIRGRVTRRGMRVTLFRVTAPRGSTVMVRCRGRGCIERRMTLNVGGSSLRLVSLERGYRAGAIIELAITQGDLIGKFTRFRARAGRAPARLDGCARPGSIRRVTCPGGRAG